MKVRARSLLVLTAAVTLLVVTDACAPSPTATPAQPTALTIASPRPPTTAPTSVPASPVAATESVPTVVRDSTPTEVPPTPTQAPPTQAPPAIADAPAAYFGANTNGEILFDDKVRALATLGGVQTVRTSVDWKNIEKTPGTYAWGGTDGMFKTLAENNFTPLVLVLNNPEWAANSPCGPVTDLLAFERFMGAVATHYPQVKYWALYNEPDNSAYPRVSPGGCFGGADINGNGKRDVEDYAEQLRIAWRAVHNANPEAQLVTGALAFDSFDPESVPPGYPGGGQGGNFDYNFVGNLFQYMQAHPLPGGEKYFDLLSFNFYFIYGPYWERTVGGISISAKANMLNQLMRDHGLSIPLLVSETGEDSILAGDTGQSAYMVKTYVRGLASNIRAMIWWTFQDFPDSAPPPSNTWKYGLIDQNKTTKPIYTAYQTASRELTGAQYTGALQVQGGEGYLFARDGGGKAVVWSSSESPVSISFAASKLAVRDMYGKERQITDGATEDNDGAAGRIGVGIDQNPVYIQVIAQ